jgi:hypothetical protein
MVTNEMTINGYDCMPRVGRYVEPDGWGIGSCLKPSDWSAAEFYLPTHCGGPIRCIAVNVTPTGRTLRRRFDSLLIRVRIEFVGDGEPSTFTGGLMVVSD